MKLTRNKFFNVGSVMPAVDSSLFPLISNVCRWANLVGSRPVTQGMSLTSKEELIKLVLNMCSNEYRY